MSLPDSSSGPSWVSERPAPPSRIKPIEPVDPVIRVDAMTFVRFRRADPQRMDAFLRDFGFVPVERIGNAQYYRGAGDTPFLISVEAGNEDAFLGFGASVREAADLDRLAAATRLPVEEVSTPGGGRRVRLTDPDGLIVDVVHGAKTREPLFQPTELGSVNSPFRKARVNTTVRPPLRPSPIFKVGHVVLERTDFDRAVRWYMRHLGILPSDVQVIEDGSPMLGFFRLNRGAEPADHHSVAIFGGPGTKLLHVSFETFDIDSVGQGHQYLRAKGWTHHWGVGRHNLGSQFFDYWKDPSGDEWEHYADGDVLDASQKTGYHRLTRGSLWTWGDDLPDSVRPDVPLEKIDQIHAAGGFGTLPLEKARQLFAALQVPPRPWLR
jgi:catechol 2,3-dioxygenase-like lactoylglutathione lyase family enzyme